MSDTDINALAQEMLDAYTTGAMIPVPPSARHEDFDLNSAYAVEAEFSRLRKQSGRRTVGLKVGYANKAMWRVLKLETLVWAHMYDDTVHYAGGNSAELQLPYDRSSKIEPEIVFKLKAAYHFRRSGRRRRPAERRLAGDRIRDYRLPLPGLAIQARGFRCRVRFAPGSGSRATSTAGIRTALDVGKRAGEFQASNFERRPVRRGRLRKELSAEPGPLPRGTGGSTPSTA